MYIKCEGSDSEYIGETERALSIRFMEHCRPSTTTSEVSQHLHMDCSGYTISLEDVTILDMELCNFEMVVKESIYIQVHKPTMNRDGGTTSYHRCGLTYSKLT